MPAHSAARDRSWLDVITPRRLVTVALLLLAVVLSVYGLQHVKDQRAASCSAGPITHLFPCPGDRDLTQGEIGVVMAPGYHVELTVDSTVVPQDQLVQAGDTFSYTPGPGSATGALAPGVHAARVSYYLLTAGPGTAGQFGWSFSTS